MWAIRKTSLRINRSWPFPLVTFCTKSEITSNSSYTYTSDHHRSLRRFNYSHVALACRGQRSYIGKHSFSSHAAGTKSSGDLEEDDYNFKLKNDDVVQRKNVENKCDSELIFEYEDIGVEVPQNDWDLSDTAEEELSKDHINLQGRTRASSGLFNAINLAKPSSISVEKALDKWLEQGNDLSRVEISLAMSELRKRRKFFKALQLSDWLEAHEKVEFGEKYYASRVDLVAKAQGLQCAEIYIEKKIPESFRREDVYQALLANCVLNTNTEKAEQVFNIIQNLKLPITTFACNQLLLLYKKTDKRKMYNVLLLMEEENIKPSLFTYKLLIDIRGQSNDLAGMEKLVEKMKEDGLEPDLRLQAVLARHYVNLGVKEKAKAVLKEMEGDNLNEKWWVCSSLLPIYALLGSEYDVKRVWETCESDPTIHDCMNAIDAFGKLKKVDEAEAVFDKLLEKCEQLSAKNYTAMLKVYVYNKMWTKGKNLMKLMDESGCGIGPVSLDVVVKFYLEAGEIEKADSILNMSSPRKKGKPLFATYMMILDEYGKRGDVANAEKIFRWMRQDYVVRLGPYNSLLQAYVNLKILPYEFRKRMEADAIFPTKFMEDQLAQLAAFKVVMTTRQCGS